MISILSIYTAAIFDWRFANFQLGFDLPNSSEFYSKKVTAIPFVDKHFFTNCFLFHGRFKNNRTLLLLLFFLFVFLFQLNPTALLLPIFASFSRFSWWHLTEMASQRDTRRAGRTHGSNFATFYGWSSCFLFCVGVPMAESETRGVENTLSISQGLNIHRPLERCGRKREGNESRGLLLPF